MAQTFTMDAVANICPPISLNVFCNILPGQSTHLFSEIVSLQLLDQIPLTKYDQLSPAISYFPSKIAYKKLPENSKINHISLAVTDSLEGKLININHWSMIVTLSFKPI